MALEDRADIPPAVPLLLEELRAGRLDTFEDARVRFKRLLPELRSQSEWFLSREPVEAEKAPSRSLDIYVAGGMDLFDPYATCPSVSCGLKVAEQFCRSVGLLGDTVWVTDFLSDLFVGRRALSNERILSLIRHTLVLSELEPLIQAGVVRFRTAPEPLCLACERELDRRIAKISDYLIQLFDSELELSERDGRVMVSTGDLFYPRVSLSAPQEVSVEDGDALSTAVWNFIGDAVRRGLWTARQAGPSGGSVFSNSRVAMAACAYIEGMAADGHQLRLLEASRELTIPYVSYLTPAQVLQLRNEADSALPAFRESLVKALEAAPRKPEAVQDSIAALREQAIEVRGELESTKKHAGRFWKTTYATLGFGACAYGASTGDIPLAVGGLLPLLQLMVSHKAGTEKDVDKLKRRPGYVLVKAQDILAHAH